MIDNTICAMLREMAERYETVDFIVGDPSWWMHQVDGNRNREATAFVASVLSYGSRAQFMPKIESLLDNANVDMDGWLRNNLYRNTFSPDDTSCFYRLYSRGTMCRFFDSYRLMLTRHGSMGDYLLNANVHTGIDAVETICRWFSTTSENPVQAKNSPVPKDSASACKRVCMFLRWMVRDHSPVDLGLWSHFIDKRTLIMPMDTHVMSEAMTLGLLSSRCASMASARRLTDALAEVFPGDPLRGDFALFGYGVNK